MNDLPNIEIPLEVQDTETQERFTVVAIKIANVTDVSISKNIEVETFCNNYREYIDPRQIEINRLNAEVKKLKEQLKPLRKKRRTLSAGEIIEVRELIVNGESNQTIAKEYQCSDSAVSRHRIEMRKEGKDV